jgi:hypothetical protein
MTLKHPSDIPSSWPILKARKKTTVSIRESIGREQFKVSWKDSVLESDPELDLIVIQPSGNEYPCKKDVFYETYVEIADNQWLKNEISRLVQVPRGETVSIETLEGTLNEVSHPDYIVIGKKDELYANTNEWAQNNLTFLQ